jgi:hypothetical protein
MEHRTTEQEFLTECNGTRTIRTFGPEDYQAYKSALGEAEIALRRGEPFFASGCAQFRSMAFDTEFMTQLETAAWAVWVLNGAVRSEFGSRQIKTNQDLRMQYTNRSYLKAWERREYVHPAYAISDGIGVNIVAVWNVRNGEAFGKVRIGLVFFNEWLPEHVTYARLPDVLNNALLGISWRWPTGTLEQDAEAVVRQRAEEIAEHLPALSALYPELKFDPEMMKSR